MSKQVTNQTVFARTVPFTVERHSFGLHRKANLAALESKVVNAPELLSLNKRLLEMPELQAIRTHDGHFRDWLNSRAIPFTPGLYLVPHGLVEDVEAEAIKWEQERDRLADVATDAYWPQGTKAGTYPEHLKAIQVKLGPLFDPRNYPNRDRFRAAYWVTWRFVEMGTPNVLREFKSDIFRREAAKTRRLGEQARGMVEQHLLSSLKGITEHLHRLLLPTESGKTRAIRDGALDDLTDFLSTVEARNITNNADLSGLTRHLRQLQAGLTVEQLREDKTLRAETAVAFESIAETLAGLVEDEPDRLLRVMPDAVAV